VSKATLNLGDGSYIEEENIWEYDNDRTFFTFGSRSLVSKDEDNSGP
jgi:hypothetical protein